MLPTRRNSFNSIIYFCTMTEKRTELQDLGEFGLIRHLTDSISLQNPTSKVGIGDDAAVLDFDAEDEVLVSTDMLVEGVHFDLTYAPLKHLGYKAVVVNLSDIYAMGGVASQITVSIAVSNRFSTEALEELYVGMRLACERYQVDLVGGDTTSSTSGLIISITAIGTVAKGQRVLRSGAKEKDLLVVTGDLGSAYMGLQLLEREKQVFQGAPGAQPNLEGYDYQLERQLKPEARKDIIDMFNELGLQPTSMIDVSDGLASELIHLGEASGLGVQLYEDKLPIDPSTFDMAREFNLDPSVCALSGGEDYELLFTISQSDYDKIKASPHFSVIGYMTETKGAYYLIDKQEKVHEITAQGWDAFLEKRKEDIDPDKQPASE